MHRHDNPQLWCVTINEIGTSDPTSSKLTAMSDVGFGLRQWRTPNVLCRALRTLILKQPDKVLSSKNPPALICKDVNERFRLPSGICPISGVGPDAAMRFDRLSVVNQGYVSYVRW